MSAARAQPLLSASSRGRAPWGFGFRFGLALAKRGTLARISIGVSVAIALFSIGRAVLIAHHVTNAKDIVLAPFATASALAWGGGVLVAFAAASQALRADKKDGIALLFFSRGGSVREYLAARVAGLAILLLIIVGAGTLAAGGAAAFAAHDGKTAVFAIGATLASLVYALFFAITLSCVAFAALGARSRPGGYLRLAAVLIVPELVRGLLGDAIPPEWAELVSIPSALAAFRSSLMDATDIPMLMRATAVVILICALSIFVIRAEIARVARSEDA